MKIIYVYVVLFGVASTCSILICIRISGSEVVLTCSVSSNYVCNFRFFCWKFMLLSHC